MKSSLLNLAAVSFVALSLQGCQQKEGFYEKVEIGAGVDDPGTSILPTPSSDTPSTPGLCEQGSSASVICNPLGGGNPTPTPTPVNPSKKLGLIASLYEGESQWNNIDRYPTEGYKHPELIYFSNFNVPTRAFDEGFGYSPTEFLKNRDGEKLIEWFAIFAKGNLTLPEGKLDGAYHIVTLSDDGIRITVDGKMIVNNPNTHAPTINCASELVTLEQDEEKSFELGYFQGPRFHIALMTFVKKIDDPGAFTNGGSHCSGSNVQNLLNQGYEVMSPEWFTLPAGY